MVCNTHLTLNNDENEKKLKPNDSHKKPYKYNPNATMKEVFKNIQIHLPKDYKFDREFANSK